MKGIRVRGERGDFTTPIELLPDYPLRGHVQYFARRPEGGPYSDIGVMRAMAFWLQARPHFTAEAIMVYPTDEGWRGMLLVQEDKKPAVAAVAA